MKVVKAMMMNHEGSNEQYSNYNISDQTENHLGIEIKVVCVILGGYLRKQKSMSDLYT